MKYLKIFTIFLIALSLVACNKEVVIEPTTICSEELTISTDLFFVFGSYAGECFGEQCIVTYQFSADGLYEDLNDPYMGNGDFDFNQALNEEKFELAKCLFVDIPESLLEEPSKTFGCPDCFDGGGFFVQWKVKEETLTWNIDVNLEQVPSSLHEFVKKLSETIELIRE